MRRDVSWLLDGRIILLKAVGKIDDEKILHIDRQAAPLIEASNATVVYMIIDNRKRTGSPNIRALLQAEMFQCKNLGWIINIGSSNPLAPFLGNLLSKMSDLKHVQFENYDAAATFLQELDATLPDLKQLFKHKAHQINS